MKFIYSLIILSSLLLSTLGCSNEVIEEVPVQVSLKKQDIIDGTPSFDPAVVGLHRYYNKWGGAVSTKPFCTGTLIAEDVILTAGHCLDKSSDGAPTEPYRPRDLLIYVGDNPANDLLDNLHRVQEVRIHEQYNKFALLNDIGLLRLSTPLTEITPISPLPSELAITHADEGVLSLHLVGFGQSAADDSDSYGVELEGYSLLNAVLPDNQIQHLYDPNNDNTTICFGDSGGPAFITRDGQTYVAGVASYTTYPVCANTGVHTKVDAYGAFILAFSPPPPSCADLNCDDGNPCTDDSCDPELGCLNIDNGTCVCLPAGDSCSSGAECCSNKCLGRPGNRTCK